MCIRCYKNVLEIEDEVDLAVVVVPSKIVKDVLIDCGKKNINYAIVISSGFREIEQ